MHCEPASLRLAARPLSISQRFMMIRNLSDVCKRHDSRQSVGGESHRGEVSLGELPDADGYRHSTGVLSSAGRSLSSAHHGWRLRLTRTFDSIRGVRLRERAFRTPAFPPGELLP